MAVHNLDGVDMEVVPASSTGSWFGLQIWDLERIKLVGISYFPLIAIPFNIGYFNFQWALGIKFKKKK